MVVAAAAVVVVAVFSVIISGQNITVHDILM